MKMEIEPVTLLSEESRASSEETQCSESKSIPKRLENLKTETSKEISKQDNQNRKQYQQSKNGKRLSGFYI